MHGVQPGTLRLVARPLPVRGYHFHRRVNAQNAVADKNNLSRRRQAQDDRKGVGTRLSHFVQAIDPIVGP